MNIPKIYRGIRHNGGTRFWVYTIVGTDILVNGSLDLQKCTAASAKCYFTITSRTKRRTNKACLRNFFIFSQTGFLYFISSFFNIILPALLLPNCIVSYILHTFTKNELLNSALYRVTRYEGIQIFL